MGLKANRLSHGWAVYFALLKTAFKRIIRVNDFYSEASNYSKV